MKFGVEVLVAIGSTHVIKRHDAADFIGSLKLAQDLAVAMFPEDPMTTRIFRSGRYVYTNKNDLGDLVVIRPMVEAKKPKVKKEDLHQAFCFVTDFDAKGPEAA